MTSLEIENLINLSYQKIITCKNELTRTDYVVIRNTELGVEIPSDVKEARANWRDEINTEEQRIVELEIELEEARKREEEERE